MWFGLTFACVTMTALKREGRRSARFMLASPGWRLPQKGAIGIL